MGVAVLEDSQLLYYGVKQFVRMRPADELLRATRASVLGLIRDYQPAVLAYEKTFFVQAKSSALLHVQEAEIKRVGLAAGLAVVGFAPAHVRKVLCRDGRATKRAVAILLGRRYGELAKYLSPPESRRERYWSNMFDALAVAVVCASELESGAQGRARSSGRAA